MKKISVILCILAITVTTCLPVFAAGIEQTKFAAFKEEHPLIAAKLKRLVATNKALLQKRAEFLAGLTIEEIEELNGYKEIFSGFREERQDLIAQFKAAKQANDTAEIENVKAKAAELREKVKPVALEAKEFFNEKGVNLKNIAKIRIQTRRLVARLNAFRNSAQ